MILKFLSGMKLDRKWEKSYNDTVFTRKHGQETQAEESAFSDFSRLHEENACRNREYISSCRIISIVNGI